MTAPNLTQTQVAKLAGITPRGLRYLEAEGSGPERERDGSYRPETVACWLRDRFGGRSARADETEPGNPLRDLHAMTVNHFVWWLFTHGAQLLAGEVRDAGGIDREAARRVFLRLFAASVLCADAYLSGAALEGEIGEDFDAGALRILGARLKSQPPQPGTVAIPLPPPVVAALLAETGETRLADDFKHWSADPDAVRFLLDAVERGRIDSMGAA